MPLPFEDDPDFRRALERTLPENWPDASWTIDQGELDAALKRAWTIVYHRVAASVYDRKEAEDLTQEVFCRVLSRLSAAGAPDVAIQQAYLVRTSQNLVLERWRSSSRRTGIDQAVAAEGALSAPAAEDVALQRVEQSDVLEALSRLPDLQRRVLRLRIMEEMSAEDVGAVIGKSPAAVRQLQHRAVLALREMMDKGNR